ncbi:MAG: AraC family transcriptional regulator, partial [Brachymonas sp.]|nr:AraC family transcriptional regulator [Brachymonas sp.]
MLALPLPYVSALLLLVLWVRLWARPQRDMRALLFVALSTLMMLLVGLRWSLLQYPRLWFALAVVSSLQAPAAWLCFYRPPHGGAQEKSAWWPQVLPFLATPVVLALLLAGVRYWNWAEALLVALYLGYGTALLVWGMGWHARLDGLRLSQTPDIQRSAVWVGCILCFSGVVEALVAADFHFYGGQHTTALVTYAQILVVVPLIYSIVQAGAIFASQPVLQPADTIIPSPVEDAQQVSMPVASGAQAATSPSSPDQTPLQHEDAQTVQRLTSLVQEQELFRDPDLTLIKLARRMGMPARELSAAVNRHSGKNMAQWINHLRIAAAQQQLSETDASVGDIMLDCGFYTKSNFNQTFRRQTGLSP